MPARCLVVVTVVAVVTVVVVMVGAHVLRRAQGYWASANGFWGPEVLPQLRMFTPVVQRRIHEELRSWKGEWTPWPEEYLKGGDDWKVIPLFAFGTYVGPASQFPVTTSILRTLPKLRTALFTRIDAGVRLEPHYGYAFLSNRFLRCHIVLECEDNTCYVEVNHKRKYVKKGDVVVFDDSLLHTAGNEGKRSRVVLLLDFDRPASVPKGNSPVIAATDGLEKIAREFNVPERAVRRWVKNL